METNIIKVEEHFWIIKEGGVRCFLFEGANQAMLIDTGFGTTSMKAIVESLTDKPISVVNTHADMDHVGCNKEFTEIYMHPSEMDYYKQHLPEGCSMDSVYPLWEDDIINLGNWEFRVILAPGHTPGSIMLLEPNRRMLFSGDSIQSGDIYMFGAGRNMPAFIYSLEKLNALSRHFDTIWPSHDLCPVPPTVIPDLLQGAKDLAEGKLVGQEIPDAQPWMKNCKLYRCSAAGFLFNENE